MAPPSSPAPLDGTYPNIQELIPTSYSHTLTCNRIQLLHAIERVSAIGDIIKVHRCQFASAITAETDVGSGAESLAVTGTLPAMRIQCPLPDRWP
jgi:DNA polymerase III sliding clamp (beta) subunit (PCNA family)